ncbi:MAG TPA: alpha/beta fold hydrolase [Nocardioidaceae bacterium]|nr:alpha/beta fold hydrolase [Nocardioidaceae bacterium]
MPRPNDQPPQQASTAAAGALAADYAERLLVGTVRDVHRALSTRVFRWTGPAGAPARLLHDGISSGVYGLLSRGLRATGAALRQADRCGRGGPALDRRRGGRRTAAIVNGFIGESLEEEHHPMAIRMAARVGGEDVTDFAAAYPDATGDVVVFLHGLVEDDRSWHWGAEPGGPTYAERLQADTSWTPVTMRFNTGLPVTRNGELLSDFLTDLLDRWPTPVRRLALVGHSMGGLVALAACQHAGCEQDVPLAWTSRVRHVVCLGTPHLGAPLEQVVYHGARVLSAFPESSPFATILNTRSAGILDLRQAVLDCTPLEGASYHCFSASMRGPAGLLLGDLLVRRHSATGRIPGATSQHLPGTHHFRLLNHPEVYADLHRRLTSEPAEPNASDVSVLGPTA